MADSVTRVSVLMVQPLLQIPERIRILATTMYPVNYEKLQSMAKVRVVSVRMSEAMHAKFVELAAKDRRPLSQFIELALEDFLHDRGEWEPNQPRNQRAK